MKALAHFLFIVSLLLGTGCASIVSQSKWMVHIDSEPPGAHVSVSDRNGNQMYQGTTPTQVSLRSGAGYFKAQRYTFEFRRDGYEPEVAGLSCVLNPWYMGNILFGGLVGMVIVDPLTGAMFKPVTEQLNVHLHQRNNQDPKFINTIPNEVHSGK
jgi:hypothetical protein